jgi:hypothetical protein
MLPHKIMGKPMTEPTPVSEMRTPIITFASPDPLMRPGHEWTQEFKTIKNKKKKKITITAEEGSPSPIFPSSSMGYDPVVGLWAQSLGVCREK